MQKPHAFLAMLLLVSGFAFSQSTVVGENCDLAVFGEKDTKTFLRFDKELRNALVKHDTGAITLLASYPLRINDSRGSYYIHDAASLALRFEELFPPPIRNAILGERLVTISCNYSGIR
jgi:hypothetical protein